MLVELDNKGKCVLHHSHRAYWYPTLSSIYILHILNQTMGNEITHARNRFLLLPSFTIGDKRKFYWTLRIEYAFCFLLHFHWYIPHVNQSKFAHTKKLRIVFVGKCEYFIRYIYENFGYAFVWGLSWMFLSLSMCVCI